MGFFDRLTALRSAPIHTRHVVAGVFLFFCMLLVLGLWTIQLRRQFSSSTPRTSSAPSPFSIIMETIKVWK
ncbi:MAG: hypothetical protein AAB343_02830 [Patescibacteria group bacterium]